VAAVSGRSAPKGRAGADAPTLFAQAEGARADRGAPASGLRYALVALARPFPEPFSYAVPAWLKVEVGHAVLVPLGAAGETGWIVGFTEDPGVAVEKIRPISRLVDPTPVFDERQLSFFRWIADYYLMPLGMVIGTAIPSQIKAKVVRELEPTDEGIEALTQGFAQGATAQVLREIVAHPGLTPRALTRRLEAEITPGALKAAVTELREKGWAEVNDREVDGIQARVRTVTLALPVDDALDKLPRAGARMRALLQALDGKGAVDVPALVAEQGAHTSVALNKLAAAGAVTLGDRERRDDLSEAAPQGPSRPPVLNDEQAVALAALTADGASGAFLLWGVTGAGKTEVFLGAAAHALGRGRQVLVLVPEIGLTPQLVGRFRARFGERVAVLHSGLTGSERLQQWRRIRAGEADVAVGARSALFAPFRDLGLVVVDEEHDDSYKQDDGVRYNARDLAVVLGRMRDAPTVLASATPSLESWYNARQGRYALLRLTRRATPRPVPRVTMVDMTRLDVPDDEERPILAPEVTQALAETFDRGGKAIVLYNRRGFATLVQCTSCGAAYECPNCGISMILHRGAGVLACHFCGLKRPSQKQCPACGKPSLEELGKGTERVEEWLAERFPDVGIARMDADTTAVRGSHARILDRFRTGDARLLVGTQIVAKGHDFPDVHTAVVVSADHGLRMPDFRAAERTWALLVQVAGRAGRGEVPGRVFLQTWAPDHYALMCLDDPDAFFQTELKLRSTLHYPPFTRLVLLRFDGVDRAQVMEVATQVARKLRPIAAEVGGGVQVLGPAVAAMAKLVGRWRVQLVLRGGDPKKFRVFLGQGRGAWLGLPHGVRVAVDVDPRHLM
jgi:primosomal protein N' (replication factor Y)